MLIELWSPAFKSHNRIRPRIHFRPGLNVIKGADDGTNSIGKSTLLLSIDFAFGGDTYLKSEAVIEAGHHTIYWAMEFNGKRYYYSRDTSKPNVVARCNEDYKVLGENTLSEYCDQLAEYYGLQLETISWKQLRTSFFRIYGKDNLDERNPLRGWTAESKEASLRTLLDIFGCYRDLAPFDKMRTDTKEEFQAFKTAQQFRFLPETAGGIQVLEKQKERIRTLEATREEAINDASEPISNAEVENEQQRLSLRRQINQIEQELGTINRRIQLVRMTEKYGVHIGETDLLALQKFFPTVDLRPIHEIERFHARLAELLETSAAKEREELETRRDELSQHREEIRAELNNLGIGPGYSREFLDNLSEIDGELGELRSKVDTYEHFQQLERAKKQAATNYNQAIEHALTYIQDTLNHAMKEISDRIVGPEFNPPVLTINGYNSYKFKTPHDEGTGTGCRGLTIYDFAMLQVSDLPVIAHDSNVLKQCDDPSVEGIMEEYGASKKQIFLAFDRADRYTQRVYDIVDEHTVIQLGADEETLFGTAWNKINKEQ